MHRRDVNVLPDLIALKIIELYTRVYRIILKWLVDALYLCSMIQKVFVQDGGLFPKTLCITNLN